MNLHYTRYPNVQIQETSLTVHIRNVVKRFVRTGNLDKGKSTEALPGSEKVVITVIAKHTRRLCHCTQCKCTTLSSSDNTGLCNI
jgi:hypothetical protein